MHWLADPHAWISLFTLTLLEIVLGIDNLIFLSILSGKLPPEQQPRARRIGLFLALITRILLLCSLSWLVSMDKPFWSARIFSWDLAVSGKDLVLLLGGLFLITKSTREIHDKLEGEDGAVTNRLAPSFVSVVIQIMLVDIVFSLDSVITAVGMANRIGVMITAVILAMAVMVLYVEQVSAFAERHPTIKMLALSFLLLIGAMLVAEGCHQPVNKGYLYFAMAFSAVVEWLNLRVRSARAAKVSLRQPYR